MTPAARIAASIELLETLTASWSDARRAPADKQIDQYFKARRYIGSKDRGAVAELVYFVLRHKATLEWWCAKYSLPQTPRLLVLAALVLDKRLVRAQQRESGLNSASWDAQQRVPEAIKQLASLFDGSKYAPSMLTDSEWSFAHQLAKQELTSVSMPLPARLNFPAWLEPYFKETFGRRMEAEIAALNEQAQVDIRANTLLTTREELIEKLNEEGYAAKPTSISPVGIRLGKREAMFASPLFRNGMFEMQDEGSQIVAYLTQAAPGMKVIDFCAGAGGKTLALAAQMKNKGRLLAWDTSARRLSQLPPRLKRAQVFNTEWRVIETESDKYIKRHKLTADRVLVDAPCSGTGTWRRNPDLKWRFSPKDLEELLDLQQRIMESASRLVKIGGRLVYATCSLLKCENEQQVERFLKTHSNFRVVCAEKIWNNSNPEGSENDVSYLWVTPRQDGVDGFFAAVLERIS